MIKEIEINGKLEKFSFGLGFLGEMLEKENIGFIEFDEQQSINPFKWLSLKMKHSYNYANDTDLSTKEVISLFDEDLLHPAIEKFNIFFAESMFKNVPEQDDEKKTKIQQKK